MTIIEVADIRAEVERKWIRSIRMRICVPDGRIRISAPMLMSERAIRQFILDKEKWIRRHTKRVSEMQRPVPLDYVTGEIHRYKGCEYRMRVTHHKGTVKVSLEGNEMVLNVREEATRERREAVVREWYRDELKTLLSELIARWEAIIGVKANRISVKQMKTIWGSCNHRTHDINFNLELMKKSEHCIEYVVVHELLHIIVRLHNDEFKALLTHYLPHWQRTQEELRES